MHIICIYESLMNKALKSMIINTECSPLIKPYDTGGLNFEKHEI